MRQPGRTLGEIKITEAGELTRLPVRLSSMVCLPDTTTARTMVASSYANVAKRYTGVSYPNAGTPEATLNKKSATVNSCSHTGTAYHSSTIMTAPIAGPKMRRDPSGKPASTARFFGGKRLPGAGRIRRPEFSRWVFTDLGPGNQKDKLGMWTHCDAGILVPDLCSNR